MDGYLKQVRQAAGSQKLILNFVAGIIRDDQGAILLQRRGAGERNAWGFPGGALELGESFVECLQREMQEETGLTIQVGRLIGAYSKYEHTYPNGDVAQPVTLFLDGRVLGGELTCDGDETLDLRFFPPTDLPLLFSPQHQDALLDYLHGDWPVLR